MANPTFLSDGNTPNRNDTDWEILQKILGALRDISGGGSGGGPFVEISGDTMTGRLVSPNINFTAQGSTPTAPASGFVEFADSTGRKSWRRASDGFVRTWDATLTADRVYTLPDATTTIAGLAVAQTFTAANTFSANGALSAPAVSFTGTPITGGSATTTKPLVLIETAGATSSSWSTSGTMFGVNAPNLFAGNMVDFQINGVSRFLVTSGGSCQAAIFDLSTSGFFRAGSDTLLTRKAAANWQFGAADAAAPVAQTLSFQSVVAGTSNTAGVNTTFKGSLGTGNAASGTLIFQLGTPTSSGSTQHAASTGLTLANTGTSGTAAHSATFAGTVKTAGYTVATLPAAGTAGRRAYVTDATAPTFLGALIGGGAVVTPVFDNGTAWVSI